MAFVSLTSIDYTILSVTGTLTCGFCDSPRFTIKVRLVFFFFALIKGVMNDQEKQVNAISEMLLIQNYLKAKRDLFRKKINTIPILKKMPE